MNWKVERAIWSAVPVLAAGVLLWVSGCAASVANRTDVRRTVGVAQGACGVRVPGRERTEEHLEPACARLRQKLVAVPVERRR